MRAGSIGNRGRRIAGPTRTDLHRKFGTRDFSDGGNELAHRPPATGAEIE